MPTATATCTATAATCTAATSMAAATMAGFLSHRLQLVSISLPNYGQRA